jgi:hypothetical protein
LTRVDLNRLEFRSNSVGNYLHYSIIYAEGKLKMYRRWNLRATNKGIDRFEQEGQIESFPGREFSILPIGDVISRNGSQRAICTEVRDTRENVHITRKFPSNLISNDSKCCESSYLPSYRLLYGLLRFKHLKNLF